MEIIIERQDLEYSIIGSILSNSDVLQPIKRSLTQKDFSLTDCALLYEIFLSLESRQIHINLITVSKEINDKNIRLFDNPDFDLSEFLDYDVGMNAAIGLSSQLQEDAALNAVIKKIRNEFLPQTEGKGYKLNDGIEKLQEIIKIANVFGSGDTLVYGNKYLDAHELYTSQTNSDLKLFGIPELDDKIVTLAPAETLIIAARPRVGKSAIAVKAAMVNVLAGKKVGFISMEMPVAQVFVRCLSYLSKQNSLNFRGMPVSEILGSPHLKAFANIITNGNFITDDSPPFNLNAIIRKIRDMVYTHKVNYICIDYIQLAEHKAENRNIAVSEISRQIKLLAKELSIPIVMLAQLNRSSEEGVDSEPRLEHLRESGSLEQDASLVAFIYPDLKGINNLKAEDEDYFNKSSEVPVFIKIAKQRNGPSDFKVALTFKKAIGDFVPREDYTKTYL